MADARGTVLIVDDDPVSIEVLGDYLTRKQLGVARAHTVDQALAELDSERPEVAVVGVRLGDTGELEAIRRIREVNVHVILLAGNGSNQIFLDTIRVLDQLFVQLGAGLNGVAAHNVITTFGRIDGGASGQNVYWNQGGNAGFDAIDFAAFI